MASVAALPWCENCASEVEAETNESNGFTCCTRCGKILDDNVFSTDPTFSKTAGGASQVDGNFVPESGVGAGVGRGTRGGRIFGLQVDSHEKTIAKGKYEICQVADRLGIRPREDITGAAHRLYKVRIARFPNPKRTFPPPLFEYTAVIKRRYHYTRHKCPVLSPSWNFTRGRRTQQVAGACLYIVCRQESRPYMLIDFSDVVQTNVYVLGAVFLQLCRLLRLEQHPLISKPIDPSLFIHRFADKLNLGRRMHAVANTALRLVASMKRDWMQTGRRPSGVCGAALWVAALLHGYERSKRDVVAVVHVGEATLRKRVTEFENTKAATLSVDEFDSRAKEFEKEQLALADAHRGRPGPLSLSNGNGQMQITTHATYLTCAHKDHENASHFAHGMCRACYLEYARVSGGAIGGEDPPAFQAAELKRAREKAKALAGRTLAPALAGGPSEPLRLPAAAALSFLSGGRSKLTATQTAEAIKAAAWANAVEGCAGGSGLSGGGGDTGGGSGVASNARAEAFLEEEMEKALDDSTSHLGEFAVLTGLRQKKPALGTDHASGSERNTEGDGDDGKDQAASTPSTSLPAKGVGQEVADAATALLKRLVGDAHATFNCLPLHRHTGAARGVVSGKHLSSTHPHAKRDNVGVLRGGRIANADKTQLHFLISAGCFDQSAMARLRKFSKHDIEYMAVTPLPLRTPRVVVADTAADQDARDAHTKLAAASKAAAAESDANHEKTRKGILKQNSREEKAARRRAEALAKAQAQVNGVPDPSVPGGGGVAPGSFIEKKEKEEKEAGDDKKNKRDKDDDDSDSDSDSEWDSDAEPETFSDVDDDEIGGYIHTEEEVKLRRVIWSELNKEYLETQAAKEAAVGVDGFGGGGGSAIGGGGANDAHTRHDDRHGKKKRKQYTHTVPAESAAEAAHAMLSSKKISSKINYDALNDLFKQDSLDAAKRSAKETGGGVGGGAGGKAVGGGGTSGSDQHGNGRRASVGLGAGRLSSRLTGFNPLSNKGEEGSGYRQTGGLGGGGLGSRLAAAGAGAAAAAALGEKEKETPRGREKRAGEGLGKGKETVETVKTVDKDNRTEKDKDNRPAKDKQKDPDPANAKEKRKVASAALADAAAQSTGRRGGKRARSTKGADWLS